MKFLLRHLTTVHSFRPVFFSCGLNGCSRTFRNIITYKHHVYARHSKHHTNLNSIEADLSDQHQGGNDDSDCSQDDLPFDDNESVSAERGLALWVWVKTKKQVAFSCILLW